MLNSPFTALSCILGIIGWITAFTGLCVSHLFVHAVSWWIIVFELLTISLSCIVFWSSTVHIYYPVILCLIAIGFPYCTNEVFRYILMGKPLFSVTVIGYIMMMITQFIWIFLYGVQEEVSILRSFHDLNNRIYDHNHYRKDVHYTLPSNNNTIQTTDSGQYPVPVSQYSTQDSNTMYLHHDIDYKIPVVAMHPYDANKEDPNELSFIKGEVIYVHSKRGSWWQARKSNGEIGMIPSNYVTAQDVTLSD